jgi:hypothetical protein
MEIFKWAFILMDFMGFCWLNDIVIIVVQSTMGFKGFTIFMDASKSLFGEMSSLVISLRESRNIHNQMGFSFVLNVGLYATYLLRTYFVSISGVHKSITLFASLS